MSFVDLLSFLLVLVLLIWFGDTDPGDVVFLFVFENVIMMLAFAVFFIIFSPVTTLLREKHKSMLENSEKFRFGIGKFFSNMGVSLIYLVVYLAFYAIGIIILDQIMVEFMVGYFDDNNYTFESLKILGKGGVFIEASVTEPMQQLIGLNVGVVVLILGGRYLIELIYNLFHNKLYLKDESAEMNGVLKIAAHAILGPVTLLISLIGMVILTAIFGQQTWIVIVMLIVFRLLFNVIFNWLNSWSTSHDL